MIKKIIGNKRAFTLVELISTLTILMLIVGIAAISISGTYKKNKEKTDQIKINNILRGTEDYVIKNKIKLVANIPLYFSVSGLVQDNVLTADANDVLKEICKDQTACDVSNSYYIKALKLLDNQVKYTLITLEQFQSDTGIDIETLNTNWAVKYYPATPIVLKEKINQTIKFGIDRPVGLPLYNLFMKNIRYDILKEGSATNLYNNESVENFKTLENGNYSFLMDKALSPGNYQLTLKIDNEMGKTLVFNPITLIMNDGVAKPLITYVEEPPAIWYKDPVSFDAWGQREITGEYADTMLMTGTKTYGGVNTAVNNTFSNLQNTANKATITINTPGVHNINLTSKITTGNTNIVGDTRTFTVRYDNILPTVSVTASTVSWTKGNVTLTCTASDVDSGIASQTFTTKTVTTNGTHSCTAIDLAGNTKTVSYTVNNIDKTAPSCTSSGGSASWTSGSRTITGTCSDSGSGCSSSSISKSYSSEINTTKAGPGTVTDNVGNSTVCPNNQTVRIDKTAPTMTRFDLKKIVSGACTGALADNGWSNVNVCILPPPVYNAIEATDGGSGINRYQISTDGASWSDLPTAWDINNSMIYIQNAGAYYRYVRAVDNVGYASSAIKRYFNIDRTAPTVSYGQCRTTDATLKSGVNIVVSDLAPTTTKVYYGYNYTGGYPWAANFSAGPASNNLFEIHSLTGPAYPENVMSTSYKYIRLLVGGNSNSSYYRAGLEVIDAAGNRYSDVSPWYLYNNTSVGYCW